MPPLSPGGVAETMLLVLLACCISVGQGQDRNWDLLNYHLYDAFSFLHGRFARDLYPVGIQIYFNPLLDLPYYLLSVRFIPDWPRVVAFVAGIPFGLLIVVVLRIARIVLPSTTPAEAWLAPIATCIGVSGSMTWSEIGTTFGDIPVAILVLSGLAVPLSLLPRRDDISDAGWIRTMLLAGFLIGTAAGLKPTACIFAPGAMLGLTLAAGGPRRACFGAVIFCCGWAAGFTLWYGWWGLMLYRRFGNPIFPMFNRFFNSPWVPTANMTDNRFFPRDALQSLFYPFFWLRGRPFVVAEVDIRDPRFALAYVAVAALTAAAVVRRVQSIGARASAILQPTSLAVGIFVVVSFIVWEAMFSVLRYALPLEALTGIIIVYGLRIAVSRGLLDQRLAGRLSVVCAVMLAALVAVSSRPGWGRLKHYGAKVYDIHAPAIPDDATIVIADTPIGFAAPFLRGKDVTFVGIVAVPTPGRLSDEIRRRVRDAATALVLVDKPPASYGTLLRSYGPEIAPGTCQAVRNVFYPDLALCGLRAEDKIGGTGNDTDRSE